MFREPPPPPRPASLLATAGWNAKFLVLFGGGFAGMALVGIAFTLAIDRGPWVDWSLDARGVRVEAQSMEVRSTSTTVNEERLYDVVLSFRDKRGTARTAVVPTTDAAALATARAKGKLSIDYDPADPEIARLAGHSASQVGGMFFLPVAFGVFGLPLAVWGLFAALVTRSIYRRGQAATARVHAVVATASSENDETVMEMQYTFPTPQGEARGKWKTVTPLAVGETLWVVYDPKKPARNVPSPW